MRRKAELVSGSERRRSQVARVETHSSGLKLDLNFSWINTFVEDRERKPLFRFVKFVSGSGIYECLWIRCILVGLTWGLALYILAT